MKFPMDNYCTASREVGVTFFGKVNIAVEGETFILSWFRVRLRRLSLNFRNALREFYYIVP